MKALARLALFDAVLAAAALALMLLLPLVEIVLRPLFGVGIANAPSFVQHAGLVLAMFGALVAERGNHLTSLGAGFAAARDARLRRWAGRFSPWVAEEGTEGLALDVTGCARLFGGEEGLVAAVETGAISAKTSSGGAPSSCCRRRRIAFHGVGSTRSCRPASSSHHSLGMMSTRVLMI